MPDRLEIFLHIQAGRLRALRALSNKIEKPKKVAALRKGPIFISNSEIRVFLFFFSNIYKILYILFHAKLNFILFEYYYITCQL